MRKSTLAFGASDYRTRNTSRAVLIAIIALVQIAAVVGYLGFNSRLTNESVQSQMVNVLDMASRNASRSMDSFTHNINLAARTMEGMAGESTEGNEQEMFHALEYVPQLSGMYQGSDTGEFFSVFRTEDGYGTMHITPASADTARKVAVTQRSPSFELLESNIDPDDEYDPRERLWYTEAEAQGSGVVWTDLYGFFTSMQPGVTLASRIERPGKSWVVGVDVELSEIVNFMSELSAQIDGEVFLYNGEGTVLTQFGIMRLDRTGEIIPAEDGAAFTAEQAEAFNRVQMAIAGQDGDVERSGDGRVEAMDSRYAVDGVGHLSRFIATDFGQGWEIGLDLSEADVAAPVRGLLSSQRVLAMTVGTLAGLLMALLFIPATMPIKRLEIDSRTDELTSLPNRRAIVRRAASLLRHEQLSIATVDLDHFKNINDTFGHPVGDEVLQQLTVRLASDGVEVGRMGGEEFVVILRSGTLRGDIDQARCLRRRIASRPVETSEGPIQVTASIGLARSRPGDSFQTVWRRSDRALMSAKSAGRNRVVTCAHPGDDRLPNREFSDVLLPVDELSL